jgi:murein DD-endopeptidase MepM/ murein hydrolase activator NlpD
MDATLSSENTRRRPARLLLLAGALTLCAPAAGSAPAAAHTDAPGSWAWPGGVARVVRAYEQPPTRYEAGHRGIDVAVASGEIVSPAEGIIAFRGVVVDRPLLTIDHGSGLVSTLEPVESTLEPGDVVARGQAVGTLAAGGHAAEGTLHLGARLNGEYINPLALLGAAERPVLLPCCS